MTNSDEAQQMPYGTVGQRETLDLSGFAKKRSPLAELWIGVHLNSRCIWNSKNWSLSL